MKVYVLLTQRGPCYDCGGGDESVGVVESELAAQMWVDQDQWKRDYKEVTLNDFPT